VRRGHPPLHRVMVGTRWFDRRTSPVPRSFSGRRERPPTPTYTVIVSSRGHAAVIPPSRPPRAIGQGRSGRVVPRGSLRATNASSTGSMDDRGPWPCVTGRVAHAERCLTATGPHRLKTLKPDGIALRRLWMHPRGLTLAIVRQSRPALLQAHSNRALLGTSRRTGGF